MNTNIVCNMMTALNMYSMKLWLRFQFKNCRDQSNTLVMMVQLQQAIWENQDKYILLAVDMSWFTRIQSCIHHDNKQQQWQKFGQLWTGKSIPPLALVDDKCHDFCKYSWMPLNVVKQNLIIAYSSYCDRI